MVTFLGKDKWRWSRKMESFPVVILLSLFLALSTLSLGLAWMERMGEREERERARLALELFLQEVKALALSSIGSEREVELELGRGELLLGEKIELWLRGEKIGEGIPALPLFPHCSLREGRYLLRLREGPKIFVFPLSRS
ncbi:MAG: hypothetical protein QXZ52_01700 [Candidatus Hadarchaeales archaeon]